MSSEIESNSSQFVSMGMMLLGIFLMTGIEYVFPRNPIALIGGIGSGLAVIMGSTYFQTIITAAVYAKKHEIKQRRMPLKIGKTENVWYIAVVATWSITSNGVKINQTRIECYPGNWFRHERFGKCQFIDYFWIGEKWEDVCHEFTTKSSAQAAAFDQPNTECMDVVEGLFPAHFEEGRTGLPKAWIPALYITYSTYANFMRLKNALDKSLLIEDDTLRERAVAKAISDSSESTAISQAEKFLEKQSVASVAA